MKLARFISHHSKPILLIALALIIPAVIGTIKTQVNYDTLSYLPTDLDSMKGQLILDQGFGSAASVFLLVDDQPTRALLDIKERVAAVPGVRAVVWLDDMIDPAVPREILPDAIRNSLFAGNSTLMIVEFQGSSTDPLTMSAVDGIREVAGPTVKVAGSAAMNRDSQLQSTKESPLYLLLAITFCMFVLALAMESYLIPFVFLAEIGLTILFNMGSNVFFGQISYLTQSLAAILQLGVTMDFSIFLLHRYDEERKRFSDKKEAMAEAISRTFVTVSGGALTEIAGFLSLSVMDLGLGRDIGFVMAKGVFFGVLGTMTVLPSIILLLDGPIHKLRHRPILPTFKGTAAFVSKHSILLSILFVLLFAPAIIGRERTHQYYNLTDVLPKDFPSLVATDKLKNDYHMMTTHFVLVKDDLPPQDIRQLLSEVEGIKGVSGVIAVEKYLGALIPEEFLPDSVRSLFKNAGKEMFIVNSLYKTASPEGNEQLDAIMAMAKRYDPESLVTGEGALTKDFVKVATADFRRVDLVSIVAIFAIILIIFTSISLPVILVGSIELAIYINMALPYFLNESIPFIASIFIGCIQLGVTIDYAILLVTRFKEELRKGFDRHTAMRLALQGSARSILTSGLALYAATSGVTIISKMVLLKTICTLISRGAIVSMIVIIFLLPSLLVLFEGVVSRTSLNWRRPLVRKSEANKESSI
jgi:predicted RND superfamily exporter protein